MTAAITVDSLSKAYRIGQKEEVPDTLMAAAQGWMRRPLAGLRKLRRLDTFSSGGGDSDIVWALKDVSFEVQEGEVVGIIGRNGAGKSTLLKILSRITEPTSGRAVIRGRVSSLLEVGTGFHPELTGRENIYMNGTILGMTKREIDRKFDEIVDFSGVEKFLDTPIKRYSSGMQVRLAFAVAAHLEPEILIVDEVLAVGDAEFQRKCLGKMRTVVQGGRTVLFVSHNLPSIESLCSNTLLMESARAVFSGNTIDALQRYRKQFNRPLENCTLRPGNGHQTAFLSAAILDSTGAATQAVPVGGSLHLRVTVDPKEAIQNPTFGIGIDDQLGQRILSIHSPATSRLCESLEAPATIDCIVPRLPLAPGDYTVKLSIAAHWHELDWVNDALRFTVQDGNLFGQGRGAHRGCCVAQAEWKVLRRAR